MLFTVPLGRFQRKRYSSLVLKNLRNKKKTRVYSWIAFLLNRKMRVEKLESEKTRLSAQKPRQNMLFKHSISGHCSLFLDTIMRVYLQIQQTIWLISIVVLWSSDTAAKFYVASKGIFNRHIRVGIDNKKLEPTYIRLLFCSQLMAVSSRLL